MLTFLKNFRKTRPTVLATPKEGMMVSHIYGEYGSGRATIVSVSPDGKRIVADANKYGFNERRSYLHTLIPADSTRSTKTEYYVREDQTNRVFSEKLILPFV